MQPKRQPIVLARDPGSRGRQTQKPSAILLGLPKKALGVMNRARQGEAEGLLGLLNGPLCCLNFGVVGTVRATDGIELVGGPQLCDIAHMLGAGCAISHTRAAIWGDSGLFDWQVHCRHCVPSVACETSRAGADREGW